MPTPPLSDELAQEAADAWRKYGNKKYAADSLGLPRQTFCCRLKVAAGRGMLGTEPTLPGYYISKETAVYGKNGDLVREFIQQKPEHGGDFEIPEGHVVKGESALVDAEGRVIQKWVKTREDNGPFLTDAIKAALEGYAPAPLIPPPDFTNYGYTGHVHNEKSLSVNTLRGLRAESFNTLAAKDAWHAGEGYQSPRNMVSITLHKDRGEVDRFTVAA